MLTVCCVFNKSQSYDDEYVVKLRSMAERYISQSHNFYCITFENILFVDCIVPPVDLPGRWLKLALFHPDLAVLGNDVLYLDLDLIICNSLDDLLSVQGSFCAPRSRVKRIDGSPIMSSNLMRWRGNYSHVWTYFIQNQASIDTTLDDRSVIESAIQSDWTDLTAALPKNYFLHWIRDGLYRFESTQLLQQIYPECAIIDFGGIPKPHEAVAIRPFLNQLWR